MCNAEPKYLTTGHQGFRNPFPVPRSLVPAHPPWYIYTAVCLIELNVRVNIESAALSLDRRRCGH